MVYQSIEYFALRPDMAAMPNRQEEEAFCFSRLRSCSHVLRGQEPFQRGKALFSTRRFHSLFLRVLLRPSTQPLNGKRHTVGIDGGDVLLVFTHTEGGVKILRCWSDVAHAAAPGLVAPVGNRQLDQALQDISWIHAR